MSFAGSGSSTSVRIGAINVRVVVGALNKEKVGFKENTYILSYLL